MKTRALTRKP